MPDVSGSLAEIRAELDKNRPDLADGIFQKRLRERGYNPGEATPLPLGDISITRRSYAPFYDYRRSVDMSAAEVSVCWREGETRFCRTTFVSRADGLVYTLITSDQSGSVSADVTLGAHDKETLGGNYLHDVETSARDGMIFYAGKNETSYEPAKGDYGMTARVINYGGELRTSEDGVVSVLGADMALIVASVFVGKKRAEAFAECEKQLTDVSFDYYRALSAHRMLHNGYYGRVNFEISRTDTSNEELLLDAFGSGIYAETNSELIEKLYAYGRYLFICSTSDSGTLPAHLLGLFAGSYESCWAIYMYNINYEMIYWQALSGNLPSFMRLALDYTEGFLDDFREAAKKLYGCRGIWIDSVNTPETGLPTCLANHIINWTAGAAWFSQHYWDYYRVTGDLGYLKEHALPFMYEAALFYEDFLRVGEDGFYEFSPSTSPENVPDSTKRLLGSSAQTSKNASLDIAAVRELLTNLLEGSSIAGMYAGKREKWEKMLELLPPYKLNDDGSLKEWAHDFYTDFNEHRHQSHMYALFPGHSVKPGDELFDAFVKAEDKRMEVGLPQQSSWSMVFMACVNARMGRGDEALTVLSDMARTCCMNNFFTVHNDWRRMGLVGCDDFRLAPFQIDANIGFDNAVNELLLNWSDGRLILLPALPSKWESGKLEGLSAAGGFIVSISWDKNTAKAVI